MHPEIAEQLRTQERWCRDLGSPLYAGLMARAVDDEAVAAILDGREGDSRGSVLPMRLLGSVHRIVLEGRAPELADAFATGDAALAWPLWRALIAERREEVLAHLDQVPQTNEVGRSAALLGGFLEVARRTKLPLALLELGSSAGLNLRWDHYRYEDAPPAPDATAAEAAWGPVDSPVRISGAWEVPPPLAPATVEIASRRGSDLDPVDPATEEGRLTLLSYVWPDQAERVARLRAALTVAAAVPAQVERIDAASFVERELVAPSPGVATVLFHSIVWQYVPEPDRTRIRAAVAAAGARASLAAPLAWLRLEPGGDQAEVRLATWPDGEDRVLATATFHGREVRWSAP